MCKFAGWELSDRRGGKNVSMTERRKSTGVHVVEMRLGWVGPGLHGFMVGSFVFILRITDSFWRFFRRMSWETDSSRWNPHGGKPEFALVQVKLMHSPD